MRQSKKHILKNSFFEEKGLSRSAFLIFFIVFLISIQIAISFKNEEVLIRIRESEKAEFDEGMRYISLKIDLMNWYKRSVIEDRVRGSGLESSNKLPYVIEKE